MKTLRIFLATLVVTTGIMTIVGCASMDQESADWVSNGFTVEEARLWKEQGFYPSTASAWKIKGYSADKARIEIAKQQAQDEEKYRKIAKSACRNGVIEHDSWQTPNLYSLDVAGKCAGLLL